MNKNILLSIGITILFLGMSITPSVAVDTVKKRSMPISNGKTLYVGGTGEGNYTRIQGAINHASVGDTVFVYDDSAPYRENIVVERTISLIGENRDTTVIDGGGYKNVIYILRADCDWVTVSGFTIQNSDTGIFIYYHSEHNNITGNIISNNVNGILLSLSGYNTIEDNIISNNGKGINLYGSSSSYNTITGNTISNNLIGIHLRGSSHNIIKGNNIISNSRYGIRLVPDTSSEPFVYPSFSVRNTILKNNFLDNKQHASFVYFLGSLNRWSQNYWNRPRILPKIIIGVNWFLPWINIDWFPALKPYDIEGVI